jgi:hypothetical protein
MKNLFLLTTAIVGLGLTQAFAQFGAQGGGQGPNFGGAMDKLFGSNQSFSATMEFQTSTPNGGDISIPGKMSFESGKSRFEMNMSEMSGTQMPASAVQQLKAMGMDKIISISRPDLKVGYLIYPGLSSYTVLVPKDAASIANPDDFKTESTEIAKETVDGHDCTKNKVTVTDKDGNKHEYTVWNASDLKSFPVKVITSDGGSSVTMLFKNISLEKPAASLFDAPSGYTKYADAQTMMQTEMMKKMGGGAAAPPAQQ